MTHMRGPFMRGNLHCLLLRASDFSYNLTFMLILSLMEAFWLCLTVKEGLSTFNPSEASCVFFSPLKAVFEL